MKIEEYDKNIRIPEEYNSIGEEIIPAKTKYLSVR